VASRPQARSSLWATTEAAGGEHGLGRGAPA
jgi:hypothetical protein